MTQCAVSGGDFGIEGEFALCILAFKTSADTLFARWRSGVCVWRTISKATSHNHAMSAIVFSLGLDLTEDSGERNDWGHNQRDAGKILGIKA
jgi:hypothetical protein